MGSEMQVSYKLYAAVCFNIEYFVSFTDFLMLNINNMIKQVFWRKNHEQKRNNRNKEELFRRLRILHNEPCCNRIRGFREKYKVQNK